MRPEQINEQELQFKKRARRRLVGAVALVIVIITLLPMILHDRATKPLRQEIAISIPSQDGDELEVQDTPTKTLPTTETSVGVAKDENKQLNKNTEQLTTEKNNLASLAQPAIPADDKQKKEDQPKVEKSAPVTSEKAEARKNKAQEEKSKTVEEKPKQKEQKSKLAENKENTGKSVQDKKDGKTEKASPEKKEITEKKANPEKNVSSDEKSEKKVVKNQLAKNGAFLVQIGVFSDAGNVKQLQLKLLGQGYKSYTEKLNTAGGEKIRLRLGSFASRAEAESALAEIRGAGISGMVITK